eukprot:m.193135 g.193135  ORF g.193135 m.193135 type:complete len:148 (-) comp21756_c0_seq12:91-534(-)
MGVWSYCPPVFPLREGGRAKKNVFSDEEILDLSSNLKVTQDTSVQSFDEEFYEVDTPDKCCFCCDGRLRKHWKITALAVVLMVAGVALLLMGILEEAIDLDGPRSAVYFGVSGVCLAPGIYVTYNIVRALRGHKGFAFENLPGFDYV